MKPDLITVTLERDAMVDVMTLVGIQLVRQDDRIKLLETAQGEGIDAPGVYSEAFERGIKVLHAEAVERRKHYDAIHQKFAEALDR